MLEDTFSPKQQRQPFHHPSCHRPLLIENTTIMEHDSDQSDGHELGILDLKRQERVSIAGKPVASKSSPGSANLLSPLPAFQSEEDRFDEDREQSILINSQLRPDSYQPFTSNSDREPLHQKFTPTEDDYECRVRKPPQRARGSWLAISILILSIYSTIFSGLWLVIAIIRPAYGSTVSAKGLLPITTVSVLCAAFAKSIELSFVAVSITFIGQVLSKRARFQPIGVTIAEMSMRSWVVQPGTMVSHWESVRYAAATRLGVFSLLVALMAMIYTTASDALVTPILKFSEIEHQILYGKVSTSFANSKYMMNHCNTPIQPAGDQYHGMDCMQMEYMGQAYYNYMQYMTTWVTEISSGNTSDSLTQRPDPVQMVRTFLIGTAVRPQEVFWSTISF